MIQEYKLKNNLGEFTNFDVYFPENTYSSKKNPVVLLVHGFRAFKDWGFFPYFAQKLSQNGFIAVTIDFSLNTLLDKNKSLFDMSRFSKNTVSQQIKEIELVINTLDNNFENNIIKNIEFMNWNKEVYLVGHSLGGALSIVAAENCKQVVKKLVTINSIYDFDIYTEKQKEKWLETGVKEFFDSNTKQKFVLNSEFLIDRLTYKNEKSITSIVSHLNLPYLIIHSEADVTVPPKAATILQAAANKNLTRLKFIKSANHTLGITHPFIKSNSNLEEVIDLTINFLKN